MGIFGGSLGKWWKQAEDTFSSGGEFGKFTKSLKQTSDYITDADYIGGTVGDQLFHRSGSNKFNAGLANLDRTTMGWSRQASPLWEGGMTGIGGTAEDIAGREGMVAGWSRKAGHHVFGNEVEGYGSGKDGGGGGDSGAVVAADTEDPSLINQGNWKRANSIESFLRREDQVYKAGLFHDRAKTQRGRLSAANLS